MEAGESHKKGLNLSQFHFNAEAFPRHALLDLARIIYSTRNEKTRPSKKYSNSEPISAIMPRVMREIERLKNEKSN